MQNSLDLFEALEGMDEYDEADLVKQHAGRPFTLHLSAEKNSLTSKLLAAMVRFREKNDPRIKARRLLEEAHIAHDFELPDLARKRLRKARKLAEEQEMQDLSIEIAEFEGSLARYRFGKNIDQELQALHQRKKEALGKVQLRIDLQHISDRLFVPMRKNYHQNKKQDAAQFLTPDQIRLLEEVPSPSDTQVRHLYHFCQSQVAHLQKDNLLSLES